MLTAIVKHLKTFRYAWILGLIWTAIASASLIHNINRINTNIVKGATLQALIAYEEDISYRRWNANHGGVYVPVSDIAVPNKYLEGIPGRIIISTEGDTLTLMNPAYMTRQVNEIELLSMGVISNLTSLNPVRPGNKADDWETRALQSMDAGEIEITETVPWNGQEFFRFMRPLYTERSCLKCHAQHGFSEGDLRGGISISIPMQHLHELGVQDRRRTAQWHVTFWLLGSMGIFAGTVSLRNKELQRIKAYKEVSRSEKKYRSVATELDIKNTELEKAYQIIQKQKERMEDELTVGHEIQMSMLPLIFPAFPDHDEFEVFAQLEPAREVGGDFYDFYLLDEEHFCFCIGDVSGKGVPAALFMAVSKTLIKSQAAESLSTAKILTQVNRELSKDNTTDMFVTLFICILNIRTGQLLYTNAGHNPPYLKHAMSERLTRLDKRHGTILGVIEDQTYEEARIQLEVGDSILLYTDGVTEAVNPKDIQYSEESLVRLLESRDFNSVKDLVASVMKSVTDFEAGAERADDITILAVEFQDH